VDGIPKFFKQEEVPKGRDIQYTLSGAGGYNKEK
jgi:hypothetical protein